MPLIDLYFPAGALTEPRLSRLAADILRAVHEAEGYAGSDLAAALSWTYLHEMPSGRLRVGFEPCPSPVWRVDIASPEGSVPETRRAALARRIAALILEAEGAPDTADEARRVWCRFADASERTWFAGAVSASAAQIRALVAHAA